MNTALVLVPVSFWVFLSKNVVFFLFRKENKPLKDRVLTQSHQYAVLTNTKNVNQ